MAPIGMVGILGEIVTPEVGIISAVVFLVLSITALALCGQCHRTSGKAYDVNGTMNEGASVPNGTTDTKTANSTDPSIASSSWRDHRNMPPSTLERTKAYTQ